MTTTLVEDSQTLATLSDEIRRGLAGGRSAEFGSAALPVMLKALAVNTRAAELFNDPRNTLELVFDVACGDRTAEGPLYVRVAAELDRMAARAVGSSAWDREDLHQEGAVRLITDARSGKIGADFGGAIGPYLGKVAFGHMLDVASTQSHGKPNAPRRLTQKLRQALRETSDEDGNYDLVGAAAYANKTHGWTLATFWHVHGLMFGGTADLYSPRGDGYAPADTLADPAATDDLERVEAVRTVRQMLASDALTAREAEVVNLVFGLDGPVLDETAAGDVLGITRQSVNKTKRTALAKLGALVHN